MGSAWGACHGRFRPLLLLASSFPLVAGFAWKSLLLLQRSQIEPVRFSALQKVIEEKTSEGLAVAPAFYLACPDPWKVRFTEAREAKAQDEKWLITNQANTGRFTPAEFLGYSLQADHFGSPLVVMGYAIANSPKGWEYALYQKQP